VKKWGSIRVTISLVICVCFVDRCFSFWSLCWWLVKVVTRARAQIRIILKNVRSEYCEVLTRNKGVIND
jgi:hypothetical protein